MKKIYLMCLFTIGAMVLSSCSADSDSELTENEIINNETTSLFEVIPDASLDESEFGLYHGVFSTRDLSKKGKIYINVGNDGIYKAEVKLRNGELIEFTASATNTLDQIQFSNERGSFTLDLTDIDDTVVTNVTIDALEGYIQVFKDRSNQRIAMALGTFVDSNDAAFTGNWDMATNGNAHPNDQFNEGFETISGIIVSINGNMFMDTNASGLGGWNADTTGCALTGQGLISRAGLTNDYFGQGATLLEGYNQPVTYNGVDITWNGTLLESSLNPQDFQGCESTTGTWFTVGGGRSGTFSIN
ncbi:MAG: hypothetical protein ACI9Y7_001226 [Dokdonia sp.]|jgi:hypothetical protein